MEHHLENAFEMECHASMRNQAFASIAKRAGHAEIAGELIGMAKREAAFAMLWLDEINGRDTLAGGIDAERQKAEEEASRYRAFGEKAAMEGDDHLARKYRLAACMKEESAQELQSILFNLEHFCVEGASKAPPLRAEKAEPFRRIDVTTEGTSEQTTG